MKPENLIVTPDGIKLIDYGIARLYDENETRDTEQFGTRGYAAPEQYASPNPAHKPTSTHSAKR